MFRGRAFHPNPLEVRVSHKLALWRNVAGTFLGSVTTPTARLWQVWKGAQDLIILSPFKIAEG